VSRPFVVQGPERYYDRDVSDLDFLVGQTVDELRYSVPGNLRMVFDAGGQVEPALYADLGPFEFVDGGGDRHEVDPEDPATVGPVLRTVGRQIQDVGNPGGALTLASQTRAASGATRTMSMRRGRL
jgi:hypothetical protein